MKKDVLKRIVWIAVILVAGGVFLLRRSEQKMSGDSATADRDTTILFYRHPMNPTITSQKPAKDEMGMDFIPVYEGEEDGSDVEGRIELTVSAYRQQLIGLRTRPAEIKPLERMIRTAGRIAFDPELYKAQEDYLAAVRSYESAAGSPVAGAETRARKVLDSLRTRLRLLGLNAEQIEQLKTEGVVDQSLILAEGEGAVWLYADVFETELPALETGQWVRVTLPGNSGRLYSGSIVSVDPNLDIMTRTLRVRVRVDNEDGYLKPGMFVNAAIKVDLGERLTIPMAAVMDTGRRKLVYVVEDKNHFIPREVETGLTGEDAVEIVSGLSEGENVVVSGNFLLDSESQLRASTSGSAFYGGREAIEKSDMDLNRKGDHTHD